MPGDDLHFIHIGPHGTFKPSGLHDSTPAKIDALLDKMKLDQCRQVIIFFHGGLVGEKSGEKTAAILDPSFRAVIGAQPVFFIWETGAKETFNDNLDKFFRTAFVHKILIFALEQVTKAWGVGASFMAKGGPGDGLSEDEIEAELAKDDPFADWDNKQVATPVQKAKGGPELHDEKSLNLIAAHIKNDLDMQLGQESLDIKKTLPEVADSNLLKPEICNDAKNALKGGDKGILETAMLVEMIAEIAVNALSRRLQGLDHGLYPTIVEEVLRKIGADEGIGKPLWDSMKEKAAKMWWPNPNKLTPSTISDAHVGTYFLERLAEYAAEQPSFMVDLVGHSAGSIAICELLKTTAERHPNLKFCHIALLAPAANYELFHSELASKPERFESFRMFILEDKLECNDAIAGKLYPRSLPYFVSGVLEEKPATPLTALERCSTGAWPYDKGIHLEVSSFLRSPGQNRLVISQVNNSGPGLNANFIGHGGFEQDAITLASLQIFLKPSPFTLTGGDNAATQ